MQMIAKWLLAAMLTALLAGCGALGPRPGGGEGGEPAVVEDQGSPAATEAGGEAATSRGVDTGGGFSGMALDEPGSPLSRRTLYFDFDSSEVRPEDREIIAAHASYLAANPRLRVVLEGHADERGSREYNIGLGERRAQAVRRLLEFQGAAPEQIRTVSYGEEKPVDPGHDEAAWAKNRRVEIVYQGQ
ncbi:peptidoglycan-associated lipoprotein Pal [Thiohalobacter sp. IOR34]|uniref:peptidoglycan-associated lipoprotein Pal n=1 Tax=Thiohalobacter sp. IOR34 TaxID=3057176 RepID=UPI0025AED8B9|nr:peptidoglycan-associated lipoprotein Pal [Thiohalobacter sp. IOR34]WJW74955.1 peptidoglycan-associated lipoprotein Pal [Thiohalobacter sp. IOR34]